MRDVALEPDGVAVRQIVLVVADPDGQAAAGDQPVRQSASPRGRTARCRTPVAFLSYVLLTTFTPGPNNIMSMSMASRHGLRRSLPFTSGIFVGFLLVYCAVSLFL
jgi:hypothetical protein